MKVVDIALTDIKPYWRNPRKNETAIAAVKQSIETYGFNSPIVVDKEHVIIAGHTRYKALLELGWTTAPCVVADLPVKKAKEYRIADNKSSELATWDMNLLIPELREITEIGDLQVFFKDINLDNLLADTGGLNVSTPTQEQIAKVEERMSTTFSDRSDANAAAYVEITCPHCGELSFVDRNELNRQPAKAEIE